MEETLQRHVMKGSARDVTDSRSYPTSHGTSGGFKKNHTVSYHQVSLKASAANHSFFLRTPIPPNIDLIQSPSQSQRNKLPWALTKSDVYRRRPRVSN